MRILALDAATQACSAALIGPDLALSRFEVAPRRHADLLLPMAEELLAEAGWSLHDLDALAFGRGPGAFTGLRIATGLIQGLALGADLPVVGISDLAALAAGARRTTGIERCLVVNDARMQEVYWAAYDVSDADEPRCFGEEQVAPPTAVAAPTGDWHPAGNGWAAYPDALAAVQAAAAGPVAVIHPHALDIARLAAPRVARGEAGSAADAVPVYVRDQVARKPA
ncbi:tRNA (adenosine(37)-N6)-threonylcarbamoyltransferase complex dimerization subunit type 1 TsaB [Salinisphaera sp. P385]|uniref:tRNA threonylcarbamoyladenosine biosynthesis protein TsaB n=1 Tax=Spectribacter acetivorans TaxID=3075603 RepID=A0ABU3B4D2_9GAMM|nr:tRNA (adenosine(37)-N6)-threonylcarbamoyltransferase complex dimerization subunit type 1 TsaB [Salinisphaera sp. P385]MDT0616980.1 tRNA (adenosine(37)-N6)-threonylcarbamoyltransferase complex dimerization subunit type 1 TsaB [Salinisphaera sp. P385]